MSYPLFISPQPFRPASATISGLMGLVPTPPAGAQSSLLRGDGTWVDAISAALPTQAGFSGRILSTDGNLAYWSNNIGPLQSSQFTGPLTGDVSGNVSGTSANVTGVVGVSNGGTALSSTPSNGQLLIGNGTGFTLSTLTAGTGVSIANTSGGISISTTAGQSALTLTATVTNAESVAITKGQVVYAFGATGDRMSVKLAYNTSDATSAKTIGIVSDTSIAANGTGTITLVGEVSGLTLGAYNEGDQLYLGATAGSLTSTKPFAPNHLVYVGIVERANNGNGELYVRVQNGYELDEIHDVQIVTPTNGNSLAYDSASGLWKNTSVGAFTTLATSGNMGIGTSVPSASAGYTTLQIDNATNGGVINLAKAGTVAAQIYSVGINATISTIQAGSTLTINPYTNSIFQIAGSEVGRFSSTGLAVTGVLNSSNDFYFTGGGVSAYADNTARLYNQSGVGLTLSGANIDFRVNSGTRVGIFTSGGLTVTGTISTLATNGVNVFESAGISSVGLQFKTNSTNRFKIETPSASNDLAFYAGGSTETVRFANSGNVGIGTTSPAARLQVSVSNSAYVSPVAIFNNADTGTGGYSTTQWTSGATGSATGYAGVGASATGNAAFRNSFVVGTAGSNPLVFNTNDTERARIDSSGNLLVGTTTLSNRLSVVADSGQYVARLGVNGTGSQNFINFVIGENGTPTGVGSVTYNGSLTLFNQTSDYRIKNITGSLTESGTFIDALKPRVGTWKSDGSKFVGFIAHEFAEVCPSAVTGEKDAVDADGKPVYQAMQASSAEVIANLVAELQSLRQRVAALESK